MPPPVGGRDWCLRDQKALKSPPPHNIFSAEAT